MPRYRIIIEYVGTPFVGWQSQASGASVQDTLAEAIFQFSGEKTSVRGAGRTDSGVHALGQVGHFDLEREWDCFRVQEALNFHLRPAPITILQCAHVSNDFDARFSATARHYLYRILCRRAPPAIDRERVWWIPRELNVATMADAANCLVGHHDFTTFRAAACQANSPMRTLDRLAVSRRGSEIHIVASARSFLHNQVRSIAGTLKLVGEGKWSPQDVEDALQARDRTKCGAVAPACGLYLTKVDYPPENNDAFD